jgi:hypothetical protein
MIGQTAENGGRRARAGALACGFLESDKRNRSAEHRRSENSPIKTLHKKREKKR